MSNKREELAKLAEEKGIHNLAAVLRDPENHKIWDDSIKYDGWVRCTTATPPEQLQVLVTDGKEVWMGYYNANMEWSVVYDGAPLVNGEDVIAWNYKPSIPAALKNS